MKHTVVAVVGGGPAGLSAALAIVKAGHSVMLIDEGPRVGGRLMGQLYQEESGDWWIGAQIAEQKGSMAHRAGVQLLVGRQVWALYRVTDETEDTTSQMPWRLELDDGQVLHASHVVLATGAIECSLAIPGWTLPGVMAVGAAQTLVNQYRVLPGERIAVVGADPLALTLTHELSLAGAHLLGIYLPANDALSPKLARREHALENLSAMASLAPNAFLKFGATLCSLPWIRRIIAACYPTAGLPLLGTKLRLRQAVVGIEGTETVEAILVRSLDTAGNPYGACRRIPADCVVLSGGLRPLHELGNKCVTAVIDELGGEVPLHGPELQTTSNGLYVAGNITGIEGAKIAAAQGHLAGCAIVAALDPKVGSEQLDIAKKDLLAQRATASFAFLPQIIQGRQKMADLWNIWESRAVRQEKAGVQTNQTGSNTL